MSLGSGGGRARSPRHSAAPRRHASARSRRVPQRLHRRHRLQPSHRSAARWSRARIASSSPASPTAPLASSRRWVSYPRSLPGACGSSCQPQRSAAPRSPVPSSTAVHSSAPRRRSSNASLVETICRVQAWPSSRSPAIAAIRVGHLARVSWPAATRVRSTPFPIGGIACIAQTIAAILLPSGFCPHLVLPSSLATRWIHKRLRPLNSFWASS